MWNNYLQNLAAESDSRLTCIDERWWSGIRDFNARYVDYDEVEHWIPIRFEVCSGCNGRGKYVNPSIDAHGLTREDFDEDPDFEESYWRGDYDVACKLCEGHRVIPVPIDMNSDVAKEILKRIEDEANYRAEVLAEIRAGC